MPGMNQSRGKRGVRNFRKVERETGLVCAEVVDVEDEFFREVLGAPPECPADSSVCAIYYPGLSLERAESEWERWLTGRTMISQELLGYLLLRKSMVRPYLVSRNVDGDNTDTKTISLNPDEPLNPLRTHRGSLKSQTSSGAMKGATKPPLAASTARGSEFHNRAGLAVLTMDGDVESAFFLPLIKGFAEAFDIFILSCISRAFRKKPRELVYMPCFSDDTPPPESTYLG